MTDKERADALAAEIATLKATMSAAGETAVTADRARRAAIMALDEAVGREGLAEKLYATGATVEYAKDILAVSPKASGTREPAEPTMSADAAELERQRLNGPGLGGATPGKFATASGGSLVANMRKQLGKETV